MRLHFVAVCLACTACGGPKVSRTCDGDVTGSIMGTFSVCNDFDELYRANLDSWSLTGAYTELPTVFTWSTAWKIRGEPAQKTYLYVNDPNMDTADLECNVTVAKNGKRWVARKGAGIPPSGTCTLAVGSVDPNVPDGNVTTYKIRGTIGAHLEAEPGSGSTGTVDVAMTFCEGDSMLCPPLM